MKYFLDELCRNASPKGVWFDYRVRKYQSAGGYDGTFAHYGMVEQGGAHTDECFVVDTCPVQGDVMSDRNIIADFYGRFLVKCVQDASVLDVYPVSDADAINISPQDGIEPDAAIVSHHYITDNRGIVGKETVASHFGSESSY